MIFTFSLSKTLRFHHVIDFRPSPIWSNLVVDFCSDIKQFFFFFHLKTHKKWQYVGVFVVIDFRVPLAKCRKKTTDMTIDLTSLPEIRSDFRLQRFISFENVSKRCYNVFMFSFLYRYFFFFLLQIICLRVRYKRNDMPALGGVFWKKSSCRSW